MATDFSSLDKLMEFGLGLGIATQMMNTMNNVIARTAVPGVGINPGIEAGPVRAGNKPLTRNEFYVVYDEHIAGPLNETEMADLIKGRKINGKTLCWKPGITSWALAEDLPEVNKLILLNS